MTESAGAEFVDVQVTRRGTRRQYTATHSFRVNHDLDAETDHFKLQARVTGWNVTNAEIPSDGDLESSAVTPDLSESIFTIADDEDQKYTLSIPQGNRGAIGESGAPAIVTLTADPKRTSPSTVPAFTLVQEPGRGFPFIMFGDGDATTDDEDMWRDAIRRALSGVAAGESVADGAMGGGSEGSRVTKDIGTIGAAEDDNRVDDIVTLKLYTGGVGASSLVTELAITAKDIHKLAAPDHITAVAKDAALNGKEVTQVVEGGDPVYLTITVDRGTAGNKDLTTGEALTVDIRASAGQAGDGDVEIGLSSGRRIALPRW